MSANPEVISELKRIADENSGLLLADKVVAAARNEDSPLHNRFEWNDSEAAHQYRLEQARHLIRVAVEYVESGDKKLPFRVFVSLSPDRLNEDGGYRSMVSVMRDPDRKHQLIVDALDELQRFQDKYSGLTELRKIFDAIAETKREVAIGAQQQVAI